ncbi:MAG TPA: alpha/beta hydrolase [Candidatus Dojkabacteria bacterium]|nr:alpha/beta hydrolase [Candidatus Dojkabacteria bacterium]
MKINYTVKGDGPPIILMHGWGGSSASLEPLQEQLAGKGFQVFNFDLPGFGQSEMLKKVMDLSDYVEFLHAFLERMNIYKPVLVGHSFGGKIAVAFAAKYGDKLARLVIIDASGINPKIEKKQRRLQRTAKFFGKVFNLPGLHFTKPLARKLFYKTIVKESDYLKAGKLKETFKNIVKEHVDLLLSKINMETLVIWGEKDGITPLWQGKKLAQGIRNARLEVIENATHNLPLVMPELVAKIISLFIRK